MGFQGQDKRGWFHWTVKGATCDPELFASERRGLSGYLFACRSLRNGTLPPCVGGKVGSGDASNGHRTIWTLERSSWNRQKRCGTMEHRGMFAGYRRPEASQQSMEPKDGHQGQSNGFQAIQIYVNDFLIVSNDHRFQIKQLCAEFKMKDLKPVKQVLKLRVTRSDGVVATDQEQYIDELLTKFNMVEYNTALTPLDVNQLLTKEMCPV